MTTRNKPAAIVEFYTVERGTGQPRRHSLGKQEGLDASDTDSLREWWEIVELPSQLVWKSISVHDWDTGMGSVYSVKDWFELIES